MNEKQTFSHLFSNIYLISKADYLYLGVEKIEKICYPKIKNAWENQ